MPSGWRLDKTCGSPLSGYVFICDGKSVLRGGKRALLRVGHPQHRLPLDSPDISQSKPANDLEKTKGQVKSEQPYPARTINDLARARFKLKLLADIRADLMICELEGWNKAEYISELRSLLNDIG